MDEVQQASAYFFWPTAVAYLLACAGWFLVATRARHWWPVEEWPTTERKWLDIGLAFAAGVCLFALGQAYRSGWLLPTSDDGVVGLLAWTVDNLLIYAPILVVVAARRQDGRTVFLTANAVGRKVGLGLALGVASVVVFVGLRGEWNRLPGIFAAAVSLGSLRNFLPVFLEAVALAFVFVRLRWVVGLWPAILIPSILFALAHVPGSLEAGRSMSYILAFFFFNGALTCAIVYTIQRSRDVIWIGMVHYLMDVAIGAF